MEEVLHDRLSQQQNDRSYRHISRNSSKYHEFIEEEVDDISVKENNSKNKAN